MEISGEVEAPDRLSSAPQLFCPQITQIAWWPAGRPSRSSHFRLLSRFSRVGPKPYLALD